MQKLVELGQSHPNIAYLYALVANTFLAIMQILFKIASQWITSFQIVIFRSVALLIFNMHVLNSVKKSPYVNDNQTFKTLAVRIGLVSAASTLSYYCVSFIPVSTVQTLFNLAPIMIFFVQAIAYKKPLNWVSLALASVSFTGVILILQPDFLFGQSETPLQNKGFYIALMLIAALAHALNMHYIHVLSKKVHTFVNVHYSHIGFLVVNSLISNIIPSPLQLQDITWQFILILVSIFFATIFTQYAMFLANSIKSPSLVMPLGYVGVLVGFTADIYLFGTTFTLLPIVGMILTSIGLLSGYLVNTSKEKAEGRKKEVELEERK